MVYQEDKMFEEELATVKVEAKAPLFELPWYDPKEDKEVTVHLKDYKGKWVVLFFYPADFTFVCPTELYDIAQLKDVFDSLNVVVFSLSTDTIYTHRAWVKHEKLMENFPYIMLSDNQKIVSDLYQVLDEATGLSQRGTFIINPEWICVSIEVTSGSLGRNSTELLRKIKALQYMYNNPGIACPAKWEEGDPVLKPSLQIVGHVYEELHKQNATS